MYSICVPNQSRFRICWNGLEQAETSVDTLNEHVSSISRYSDSKVSKGRAKMTPKVATFCFRDLDD